VTALPRQHEVLRHELRDQFLRVGQSAERAEQGHFNFSEKCPVVVALIGKQNIARVHAEELNFGEPVHIDLLGGRKAYERRDCGKASLGAAHYVYRTFQLSRPLETPYACCYSANTHKRANRCDSASHTEAPRPSALWCVKFYSFAEVTRPDRSAKADDREKKSELSSHGRCGAHAKTVRGGQHD
jgi:hypothetical protein